MSRPTNQAGWLRWAQAQDVTPASAKDLLKTLAIYVDIDHSDGTCFPSHKTLAADMKRSSRRIRQLLDVLKDANLVDWTPQFDADGGQNSNVYLLAPPGSQLPTPLEASFHPPRKPASPSPRKPASRDRYRGTETTTKTGDRETPKPPKRRSPFHSGVSNPSSTRSKRQPSQRKPTGGSSLRSQQTPPPAPAPINQNGTHSGGEVNEIQARRWYLEARAKAEARFNHQRATS